MTRNEYTKHVLSAMRRVTAAEREAIRAELDAHMEDHMEALKELGYDDQLAERRTLERMGDPEEVGRELDQQYPLFWLVLKWAAKAAAILLALVLLTQVSWMNVWWNLCFRLAENPVNRYEMETFAFLREHPVDARMEIDSVTIRACAAGIMKTADYPYWGTWGDVPDTVYVAAITLCAYSTDWSDLSIERTTPDYFRIQDGSYDTGCSASGGAGVCMVPVKLGQEFVTATYQKYGYDLIMEIPLDWEGVE